MHTANKRKICARCAIYIDSSLFLPDLHRCVDAEWKTSARERQNEKEKLSITVDTFGFNAVDTKLYASLHLTQCCLFSLNFRFLNHLNLSIRIWNIENSGNILSMHLEVYPRTHVFLEIKTQVAIYFMMRLNIFSINMGRKLISSRVWTNKPITYYMCTRQFAPAWILHTRVLHNILYSTIKLHIAFNLNANNTCNFKRFYNSCSDT